ncbi:aldolase/citrate lyase family protein, partial [Rhizorhabdus wittichii]|uniref:aldolase/citrate lyase family protein n=1 Tax=Rhizorhabdus wittichii TaxID=160791 RepID=UPI00035EC2EA
PSRWNRTRNYLNEAQDEICLMVQIESAAALAALPSIAELPGVDGIFIGPSDLAASLGHLGDPGHAAVQRAIERAIATVRTSAKAVGILAADEGLARRYIELGATFVAVGTDVTLLARGAEALARRFKGGRDEEPRGATIY